MRFVLPACCLLLVVVSSLPATAADWPRFRGPNGSGVSDEEGLPVSWGTEQNIKWKAELPGRGTSSPIACGGRVFLTCYTGYGLDRADPGDPQNLERHLICLDPSSGQILWQRSVQAALPEDPARGFITDHGYASSTPATDGERVYVFFGKSGVLAFDFEGNQLWQADVGSGSAVMGWGSAASPIIYKDLVIVNASAESEAVIALDRRSGGEVWKAQADGISGSWSTPVLVDIEGGRQELVVGVPYEVWALNPDTGKLVWYAEVPLEQPICPSLVAGEGIVYAVGGRGQTSAAAIRAGGKGDVTGTHLLWTADLGSYVPSPVVHGGHLYWVSDRGQACCLKADSGEVVYRQRLADSGQLYASVVLADDKLYAVTRANGTFVLAAGPKFEQLAHNRLESDESSFNASPAVAGGNLLLRSDRFLYCIHSADGK